MTERLASIKGKFIFSINDVPQICELFAQFELTQARTTYSVAVENGKQAAEIIIANYRPEKGEGVILKNL